MSRRSIIKGAAGAIALPSVAALLEACSSDKKAAPTGTSFALASPSNPVLWPIDPDNKPIADGLAPVRGSTLKLYNYEDYIDPAALASFKKTYGVTVEVSTFNDTTEALTKIRSGKVDFDIYFPSYDQIGKMITGKLLRPLNHSYIANIGNAWPQYTNPFYDQEWRYTVPYTVYTTGIAWRNDVVTEDIGTRANPYDVFWDPRYAGKVEILDDYRTAMGMVLLRNKRSLNTTSQADLDLVTTQLTDLTKQTHPKVAITDYTDLPEGKVAIAQAWSGDVVNALSYLPSGTKPEILRYWFPADGKGEVDNDLLVILRSGKNPVAAHLFLNHMLDYETAKANFSAIGYQPPQNKITPDSLVADGFLPENLKSATVLPSTFTTGQRILELPPDVDAKWQDVWQRFKAGS